MNPIFLVRANYLYETCGYDYNRVMSMTMEEINQAFENETNDKVV